MYTNTIDPTFNGYNANVYGTTANVGLTGQNVLGFKPSWTSLKSLVNPVAQGVSSPYSAPYQGYYPQANPWSQIPTAQSFVPYQGFHQPHPLTQGLPLGVPSTVPGITPFGFEATQRFNPHLPFHPTQPGLALGQQIDPRFIPGFHQGVGDINALLMQQYLISQEIQRCQALGCVPSNSPAQSLNFGLQPIRVI